MPNLFHTAWAAGPQTPTYNPYTPIEDEESERLHHYKSPASQDENRVKGRREGSDGFWLRAFGLLLGIYVFTIVLVMVNWRRPEGSTDNRPSQRVFSECELSSPILARQSKKLISEFSLSIPGDLPSRPVILLRQHVGAKRSLGGSAAEFVYFPLKNIHEN